MILLVPYITAVSLIFGIAGLVSASTQTNPFPCVCILLIVIEAALVAVTANLSCKKSENFLSVKRMGLLLSALNFILLTAAIIVFK